MRKFKCIVTRTDEYEIEVDETIVNQDWMADFGKSFFEVDGVEDLAENIATMQARYGSDMDFIEGYGYITRDGELPFSSRDYDDKGNLLPIDKQRVASKEFNINIISEDEDLYVVVDEIEVSKQ